MKEAIIELTKLYLEKRDQLSEEERRIILSTLEMASFKNPTPNVSSVCSVCGIDFTGTMGYVCGNTNCPIKGTINC